MILLSNLTISPICWSKFGSQIVTTGSPNAKPLTVAWLSVNVAVVLYSSIAALTLNSNPVPACPLPLFSSVVIATNDPFASCKKSLALDEEFFKYISILLTSLI